MNPASSGPLPAAVAVIGAGAAEAAAAVDIAMRGGVGYPIEPLEWAERLGSGTVLAALDHLAGH